MSIANQTPTDNHQVEQIINVLQKRYPAARCQLNYRTPYELMIACILYSQATIEEVNSTTRRLFAKYDSPQIIAHLSRAELEKFIHPSAFYRRKAKSIQLASMMLVQNFGGKLPTEVNELMKLPGLARKGINLLLAEGGNKVNGIAVDSHVWRVSERLGWANGRSAEKVERQLLEIIPQKHRASLPYLMLEHSTTTCAINEPQCNNCPLNQLCTSANLTA